MTVFMIDVFLLTMLVIIALAAINARSLLAAIMFLALYSMLMALVWVTLHAVDVAFTEAAVGAGISTILLVGTLAFIDKWEKKAKRLHWPALLAVIATGALMIYGTLDMPTFGDPQAPIQQHVAPRYIEQALTETNVPNMVTAVLASYRGYDTLFETVVIFTAGIGLILLLRATRHPRIKGGKTP
jgi:multicomponent Na+:H+ antiporter subunit B